MRLEIDSESMSPATVAIFERIATCLDEYENKPDTPAAIMQFGQKKEDTFGGLVIANGPLFFALMYTVNVLSFTNIPLTKLVHDSLVKSDFSAAQIRKLEQALCDYLEKSEQINREVIQKDPSIP